VQPSAPHAGLSRWLPRTHRGRVEAQERRPLNETKAPKVPYRATAGHTAPKQEQRMRILAASRKPLRVPSCHADLASGQ